MVGYYTMNKVTIAIAVIILVFVIMNSSREGFETIADKEKAHREYFAETRDPSYEDYRERVTGGNVVDYMKYKQ